MSRRAKRRGSEDTNISFLDVICCGFGAIVLLLVIVKPTHPPVLEESLIIKDGQVRELQERLFKIRGQVTYLETELNAKHEQLGKDKRRVAILHSEFDVLNSRMPSLDDEGAEDASEVLDLQKALQTISLEMRNLLRNRAPKNNYVGGIPVDSEYVIIIVDTSPSMTDWGLWSTVLQQVRNTLNLYPRVKGIQVMNDNGRFLFPTERGGWMTDSAARRKAIIRKLAVWRAGSNSSPVEGVTQAIRSYYDKNKKISLFIYGDDYSGRSIRAVITAVNRLNEKNKRGESLVRIHTVGIPVHLPNRPRTGGRAMRYANLMRELAQQNDGAFVGTTFYGQKLRGQ